MTGVSWMLFWAALISAPGYLMMTLKPESVLRSVIKVLPAACLACAAYVAGASPYLTSALVFAGLGDAALSRSGRVAFLYGLSAFALSHLTFILLFLGLGGAAMWEAFAISPLLASAMLAAALSTELWLTPHTGAMRWPVRGYIALIAAMGLTALTVPAATVLLPLGVVCFMVSDSILSIALFRLKSGTMRLKVCCQRP